MSRPVYQQPTEPLTDEARAAKLLERADATGQWVLRAAVSLPAGAVASLVLPRASGTLGWNARRAARNGVPSALTLRRTVVLHAVVGLGRSVCRAGIGWVDRLRFVPPERPALQEGTPPANVLGNILGNVIGGVR